MTIKVLKHFRYKFGGCSEGRPWGYLVGIMNDNSVVKTTRVELFLSLRGNIYAKTTRSLYHLVGLKVMPTMVR